MTTTDDTKPEAETEAKAEDTYSVADILTIVLTSMAPEAVLRSLVLRVRQNISVKAGDELEKYIKELGQDFPDRDEMYAHLRENLDEELRGEMSSKPTSVEELLQVLTQMLGGGVVVVPVTLSPAQGEKSERQFVEPTPNCECPACTKVRALMEKGVRVDAQTGEEVHIN